MHHALHLQAVVDRLYFKRAEGGRGLMIVEDSVNSEINSLSWYVESCNGTLLEAVYKEEVLRCYAKSYEATSLQQERKERFQKKKLHGQFWRNTAEIRDKKTWEWLKKGRLKKETEGMIMAAQDQALRTNSIKRIIDKQNVSVKCRMCGEGGETVSHIVSGCKKLVQKQHRCWRHDKVAQVIHWDLCGKLGYDREEKYYNHEPQPVYESTNNKLLWDFN